MWQQIVVFAVLILTLVLLVSGRLRYDLIAVLALLTLVFTGIVDTAEAFAGFGHPAVVTVAAVLVVSRGLRNSGVVELLARVLVKVGRRPSLQVGALSTFVTGISGFVSSIGAAALLIPVAVRMSRDAGRPPSLLLMPLAFGSLLGAMVTLIGSSPNIIIAAYRAQVAGTPFKMFDYTPVGAGVAIAGILFMSLIGWRFLPRRKGQAQPEDLFDVENYLTEVRLTEESRWVGKQLKDLESGGEFLIAGLVRGARRRPAPSPIEELKAGDILILQADSEVLPAIVDKAKLELVGSKEVGREALGSEDVAVWEVVVGSDSEVVNKTVKTLNLRRRWGVNLLAVARQGDPVRHRLGSVRFRTGDVLLLQGQTGNLQEAVTQLGCLPLAERGLQIGRPRRAIASVLLFVLAVLVAAVGILPVQVAFVAAAAGMILIEQVSLKEAYESVDWPILVLLGCMIPVGQALETTGGAQLIANQILALARGVAPVLTLTVLLVGTMCLSDLINNAAAAVLMAPIAVSVASGIGASIDPFLIAVAIGSSAAFLTPIGHQSNTLVMGPGGYRFNDYWRLGLPLEIVVIAAAIPLLLYFWPL
jgi:di/tricarboxylate transporter